MLGLKVLSTKNLNSHICKKNYKKDRKDFIKSNIYIDFKFGYTIEYCDKLTSNDIIIWIIKSIKRRLQRNWRSFKNINSVDNGSILINYSNVNEKKI